MILDPSLDDDVFDIEAEKRRARLSDAAGGRIARDDPRKSMLTEHLLGSGRVEVGGSGGAGPGRVARNDPRKSLLTEHLLGSGRASPAKEPTPTPGAIAPNDPRRSLLVEHVLGTERAVQPRQALPTPGTIPDTDPRATSVSEALTGQLDAKTKVEAKAKALKKELAAAATYKGTTDAPAELALYEFAVAEGNWSLALPPLEQMEVASKAALESARNAWDARKAEFPNALKLPACHKPADLTTLGQAAQTAIRDKDWIIARRAVADLVKQVDLGLDFAMRLAEVKKRAALLADTTQKKNMTEWIALHEQMSWDQVVATQHSTFQRGALADLEDRLLRYEGRAGEAESAAKLLAERQTKGLIANTGKVIAEKKVSDLTGQEKTAVDDALAALDGGTVVALTHPNGMKWADPHANRDGDLPGTKNGGGYREYYVQKAAGSSTYHGNRRLVVKNGKPDFIYYTNTHYGENGSPPFYKLVR